MGARSAVMAVTSRSISRRRLQAESRLSGGFPSMGWRCCYGVPIQRPIRDGVRDQTISVARDRRFSTGTIP